MAKLSIDQLNQLAEHSTSIRQSIIKMLTQAQTGHSAGSLGMADVLTVLYFEVMKHRPKQPNWSGRDYLVLSNGHICPVLYATLAEAGYFPKKKLLTLRQIDSELQGHPHLGSLVGIENTSGPLGQGISQAVGLAWGLRHQGLSNRIFCLMSDAEFQEGQTWEAFEFAAKYQLSNLTVLIDRNHIQIEGTTEQVMPLEPLAAKLTAFNWQVQEINGHDYDAILQACTTAKKYLHQPRVIICQTVPGKGVTFMENSYIWHGKPPTTVQEKTALRELRSLKGTLTWD